MSSGRFPNLGIVDTLASIVSFLFVSLGVSLVASALSSFMLLGRMTDGSLDGASTDTIAWVAVSGFSSLAYGLLLIPAAVLFLCFVYYACDNARVMDRPDMRLTPGWAVGWFFVPIANLFKPYQALREIHRASDPEASGDSWRLFTAPGYFPLWWWSWIGYNLAGIPVRVVARLSGEQGALVNAYEVARALIGILSVISLVLVVDGIRNLQKERAARLLSPDQTR